MSRRSIFTSLAFFAFAACTVLSVLELLAVPRYNVILLTVESARNDAFSPRDTPNIERLARQGTRFTHHRAASAWTGANIVSVLTGLSAFRHGVHSRGTSVPEAWDMPLEVVAKRGWRVAGLQSFMLIEGFRGIGLDVSPERKLLGWLAEQARKRKPFFLWSHYLDTHLPYDPSDTELTEVDGETAKRIALVRTKPAIPRDLARFEPTDRAWLTRLYRGQFREFDAWFADFWNFLEASGLRRQTIVVLTTDHGEELLERGMVGHASTTRAGHLYEEIVRIPLIVWLPDTLRKPNQRTTIDAPSSHLDIMPTIFRLLGIEPLVPFEGQDLFALPSARAWNSVTSRAGFAEAHPDKIDDFVAARVEDGWKLQLFLENRTTIVRRELFDLLSDPAERNNRVDAEPDTAARMTRALLTKITAMRVARPGHAATSTATPTTPPRWIFPAGNGAVGFDDLPARLKLQWRGDAGAEYRIQYRIGEGVLAIAGEMMAEGPSRDFGPIPRTYWNRYIVPYGVAQFRVGYAGHNELWSPWITVRIRE